MKREGLSKKFIALAICGALIITALGVSLVQSQASSGTKGINAEKAAAIAMENAGIAQEDVVKLSSTYDQENGKNFFEVGFYAKDFEYDYIVAASDGIILEAKREMMDSDDYKDAGLEIPESLKPKAETKKEQKKESSSSTKTDSTNTQQSSQSQQSAQSSQSSQESKPQQSTSSSGYIGTDKAKSIALNKAGLSSKDVTFTKAKLDKDDGVYVYEIEFVSNSYEYEFEINAKSGKIIDYDVDDIDD